MSPTLFVLFLILKNGSVDDFDQYNKQFGPFTSDDLQSLKDKKLIKTTKGAKEIELKDINQYYDETSDPIYWSKEFLELFPKGASNRAGYYIRSNGPAVLSKLQKFVRKHKKYANKDIILQATKNYIGRQAMSGFEMCKLAPWFVEKDGISILESECRAIIDNESKLKGIDKTDLI